MTSFFELHHPLDEGYSFFDLDWTVQAVDKPEGPIDNDYLLKMLQSGSGLLCMTLKDRNLAFSPTTRHYLFSLASLEEDGTLNLDINGADENYNILGKHSVRVDPRVSDMQLSLPRVLFNQAIGWHAKEYGPGPREQERRAQWEADNLGDTTPSATHKRSPRL